MTLPADIQKLALECLRRSQKTSPDGNANASAAHRALRELGVKVSIGALTRLCNVHGIPIKPGRREGAKITDPRASRGGRPAVGRGQGTTYSPYRARAWELKHEDKSLQQIAEIMGPEFGRTFTKQGIAKLLGREPNQQTADDSSAGK